MASWAGLGQWNLPSIPDLQPSVWRSGYARLGVRCLVQGHLSRGIEGGESVYIHSPHRQFLPARDSNSQPFDYESDSLTIRPQLPTDAATWRWCGAWVCVLILPSCLYLFFPNTFKKTIPHIKFYMNCYRALAWVQTVEDYKCSHICGESCLHVSAGHLLWVQQV